MLRLIAAELRFRRGRALALLAGIAVATASFTVLTGASQSSKLEVRGQVARHFRTAYDVLVRPRGAPSALERQRGPRPAELPRRDLRRDHDDQLEDDPPRARRPDRRAAGDLRLRHADRADHAAGRRSTSSPGKRALFRLRSILDRRRRRASACATPTPTSTSRPARSRRRRRATAGTPKQTRAIRGLHARRASPADLPVALFGGLRLLARRATLALVLVGRRHRSAAATTAPSATRPRRSARAIQYPFPLLVAGIDPKAEAALDGADRAVVSGRWFKGDEDAQLLGKEYTKARVMPILAASTTPTQLARRLRDRPAPARRGRRLRAAPRTTPPAPTASCAPPPARPSHAARSPRPTPTTCSCARCARCST